MKNVWAARKELGIEFTIKSNNLIYARKEDMKVIFDYLNSHGIECTIKKL